MWGPGRFQLAVRYFFLVALACAIGGPGSWASAAEVVFRVDQKNKGFSTAVVKRVNNKKIALLPQMGLRGRKKDTIEVELDASTRFWDSHRTSKKVTLRPGKTEWLWLYVPIPAEGSLGIHPAPEFRIDGIRPALFNLDLRPIDALRNEYIASAVELGDTRVIQAVYGKALAGKTGTVRQVLRESDFQEYTGDQPWVDHFVSSVERLRNSGCDVYDGTGDYAYPVYLDVNQRLEKATYRVLNQVADRFVALAKQHQKSITADEILAELRVTSGYRNPSRNRCIGGSELSRHQMGLALDLSFQGGAREAASLARLIGVSAGKLWHEYAHTAGRALAEGKAPKIACRNSLFRSKVKRPESRFSENKVDCGCENGAEFVHCEDDVDVVDHVHVSF